VAVGAAVEASCGTSAPACDWAEAVLRRETRSALSIRPWLSSQACAVFCVEGSGRTYWLKCWNRGWESGFRYQRDLSALFEGYAPRLIASTRLHCALLVEGPPGQRLDTVSDPGVWRQVGVQLAELQQRLQLCREKLLGAGCPLLSIDAMLHNLSEFLSDGNWRSDVERFEREGRRALHGLADTPIHDSLVPRLRPCRIFWTGERAVFSDLGSGFVGYPFFAEEYLGLDGGRNQIDAGLACEAEHGYYGSWTSQIRHRTLEHAKSLVRFAAPLAAAFQIWLRGREGEALSDRDRIALAAAVARSQRELQALADKHPSNEVPVCSHPSRPVPWHDPSSRWARRLLASIRRGQRNARRRRR
jgi:hypothetical protein